MEEVVAQCGEMVVYTMGGSFIFGSLFTVFIMLVLELMKSRRSAGNEGGKAA